MKVLSHAFFWQQYKGFFLWVSCLHAVTCMCCRWGSGSSVLSTALNLLLPGWHILWFFSDTIIKLALFQRRSLKTPFIHSCTGGLSIQYVLWHDGAFAPLEGPVMIAFILAHVHDLKVHRCFLLKLPDTIAVKLLMLPMTENPGRFSPYKHIKNHDVKWFKMTDHLATLYPSPVHLCLLIKGRQNDSLNSKEQ